MKIGQFFQRIRIRYDYIIIYKLNWKNLVNETRDFWQRNSIQNHLRDNINKSIITSLLSPTYLDQNRFYTECMIAWQERLNYSSAKLYARSILNATFRPCAIRNKYSPSLTKIPCMSHALAFHNAVSDFSFRYFLIRTYHLYPDPVMLRYYS